MATDLKDKKKPKKMSLSDFNKSVGGSQSEDIVLPTGPKREDAIEGGPWGGNRSFRGGRDRDAPSYRDRSSRFDSSFGGGGDNDRSERPSWADSTESTQNALVDRERSLDNDRYSQNRDRPPPTRGRDYERREYGNERRDYGHERREYGHERREYGNERREYGNERREYGNERREYGNERREYGHERREHRGDREYGNERRDFGNDKNLETQNEDFPPLRERPKLNIIKKELSSPTSTTTEEKAPESEKPKKNKPDPFGGAKPREIIIQEKGLVDLEKNVEDKMIKAPRVDETTEGLSKLDIKDRSRSPPRFPPRSYGERNDHRSPPRSYGGRDRDRDRGGRGRFSDRSLPRRSYDDRNDHRSPPRSYGDRDRDRGGRGRYSDRPRDSGQRGRYNYDRGRPRRDSHPAYGNREREQYSDRSSYRKESPPPGNISPPYPKDD